MPSPAACPPSSTPRPAASSRPRCASRSTSARSTPGATASSARSPRTSSTRAARARATIRGLRHTPGRRLRLGALQAQGPRQEPRRVRAPDRGLQGARHRLFLLQRRQRLDGHRAQGVPDRRVSWAIPIICVGVPKTVDNDLPHTDCCPGFGSVAKYVAVSTREAALDVASMARTSTKVFVLEVMGRHAGWIAAAGGLAGQQAGRAAAHHPVPRDRLRASRNSSTR